MPAPINEQLRADIIRDIQDSQLARNQIARNRGVSPSTVTAIARQAGLGSAFDRSKTAAATHAKTVDTTAARAALIERLYGFANRTLDRAESPYTQIVAGPAGAEFVKTKLPPLRDVQSAMSAVSMAMDKAGRAEDRNGSGDTEVARSLLGSLFDHLAESFPISDGPGGG